MMLKRMASLALAAVSALVVSACGMLQQANLDTEAKVEAKADTPRMVVSKTLRGAYAVVGAYVQVTEQSLLRGRITLAQAEKASANAKKVKAGIDDLVAIQAKCPPPPQPASGLPVQALPCSDYLIALEGLQPMLLELERELRERQAALDAEKKGATK
jgi:hypothetical protein